MDRRLVVSKVRLLDRAVELECITTRSDMERRMRLLEMAGGNLEQAIALERWVQIGTEAKTTISPTALAAQPSPDEEREVLTGPDTRAFDEIAGEIPAHLRR